MVRSGQDRKVTVHRAQNAADKLTTSGARSLQRRNLRPLTRPRTSKVSDDGQCRDTVTRLLRDAGPGPSRRQSPSQRPVSEPATPSLRSSYTVRLTYSRPPNKPSQARGALPDLRYAAARAAPGEFESSMRSSKIEIRLGRTEPTRLTTPSMRAWELAPGAKSQPWVRST
jgi:hypothetical protein